MHVGSELCNNACTFWDLMLWARMLLSVLYSLLVFTGVWSECLLLQTRPSHSGPATGSHTVAPGGTEKGWHHFQSFISDTFETEVTADRCVWKLRYWDTFQSPPARVNGQLEYTDNLPLPVMSHSRCEKNGPDTFLSGITGNMCAWEDMWHLVGGHSQYLFLEN